MLIHTTPARALQHNTKHVTKEQRAKVAHKLRTSLIPCVRSLNARIHTAPTDAIQHITNTHFHTSHKHALTQLTHTHTATQHKHQSLSTHTHTAIQHKHNAHSTHTHTATKHKHIAHSTHTHTSTQHKHIAHSTHTHTSTQHKHIAHSTHTHTATQHKHNSHRSGEPSCAIISRHTSSSGMRIPISRRFHVFTDLQQCCKYIITHHFFKVSLSLKHYYESQIPGISTSSPTCPVRQTISSDTISARREFAPFPRLCKPTTLRLTCGTHYTLKPHKRTMIPFPTYIYIYVYVHICENICMNFF